MANQINKEKKDFTSNHDAMLVDLDSGEKLHFQGLPMELDFQPETSWAVIKTFGRNNPHYHFTGSEDTLVLEVSWYAEKTDLSDVPDKCLWVKSLTKSDGYVGRPHLVSLIWGNMFKKQKFIVHSAPYKFANFNKEQGMRPMHATQVITLKRVTDHNLTLKEVLEWN